MSTTTTTTTQTVPETETITPIIFRKWRGKDGTIFALFPAECASCNGDTCSSFEHVGQHAAADYGFCIAQSTPATPDEYAALKRELESEPYNYRLQVCQRRTPQHRAEFDRQYRALRKAA